MANLHGYSKDLRPVATAQARSLSLLTGIASRAGLGGFSGKFRRVCKARRPFGKVRQVGGEASGHFPMWRVPAIFVNNQFGTRYRHRQGGFVTLLTRE